MLKDLLLKFFLIAPFRKKFGPGWKHIQSSPRMPCIFRNRSSEITRRKSCTLLMLKKAGCSRKDGCQTNAWMQSWTSFPEKPSCDAVTAELCISKEGMCCHFWFSVLGLNKLCLFSVLTYHLWLSYFTRAPMTNQLRTTSFKNLHRIWVTGSLTSFHMNLCCQEQWNIVPGVMLWKAFTALQAEVMFLNTTIALCRPQRVTDLIGPNTDSLWITDWRSSVGCMFFFNHLASKQMEQ